MSNQNQNQGKSNQKKQNEAPKAIILDVILQGLPIWVETKQMFQQSLVLTATQGEKPYAFKSIIMIDDTHEYWESTTDHNGVINSYCEFRADKADQYVKIFFQVKGKPESKKEVSIKVGSVPKPVEKKPAGAVYLFVGSYQDEHGKVGITARVLDQDGNGLDGRIVNIEYRGENHLLEATANGGYASHTIKDEDALKPNETLYIYASVSGILEPEKLVLESRAKEAATVTTQDLSSTDYNDIFDPPPGSRSEYFPDVIVSSAPVKQPWSNNKKAMLFCVIMIAVWVMGCFIGWGDNLVFNRPHLILTPEEMHHNEIVKYIQPEWVIKPDVSKGNWQKVVWLGIVLWSLFAIAYSVFIAPSDEVMRFFKNVNKRMKIKTRGSTHDSWLTRLLERFDNNDGHQRSTSTSTLKTQIETSPENKTKPGISRTFFTIIDFLMAVGAELFVSFLMKDGLKKLKKS